MEQALEVWAWRYGHQRCVTDRRAHRGGCGHRRQGLEREQMERSEFKHEPQGTPQFTEQPEEEEPVIEMWVVSNVGKEPAVHFSSADL